MKSMRHNKGNPSAMRINAHPGLMAGGMNIPMIMRLNMQPSPSVGSKPSQRL